MMKASNRIQYKTGSLFDAPKGSVLVHACNGKGVWGSGIAKQFKEKFPYTFQVYNEFCNDVFRVNVPELLCGKFVLVEENEYKIGCLITSLNYGKNVDSYDSILRATELSFSLLLEELPENIEIHMPKINSGLFKVPWDFTEKVLNDILSNVKQTCIVWEL